MILKRTVLKTFYGDKLIRQYDYWIANTWIFMFFQQMFKIYSKIIPAQFCFFSLKNQQEIEGIKVLA